MITPEKQELEWIREEVLGLHAKHGLGRLNIHYEVEPYTELEKARSYLRQLKLMIKHIADVNQRTVKGLVKDLRYV